MYYPKSKIITNLYTNGNEFYKITDSLPYVGFYHVLFNGKTFSGKNPNDNYIVELVPIINQSSNRNPNISIFATGGSINPDSLLNGVYTYGPNDDKISDFSSDLYPKYSSNNRIKQSNMFYYPQLTQKEYNLGEFQRYFIKKVNELQFLEINKNDYNNIKSKNPEYAFEYYILFNFAWQIYGNRVDILKINRNTVLLQEQNLKIRGLQEFLQNKYDKFYQYPVANNLVTNGYELQRANQTEYIGPYHVEADRGFVVGAQPSNTEIQPTLFSVNLEKEKILLDNALKSIGQFVYPTPIYDVIRKK